MDFNVWWSCHRAEFKNRIMHTAICDLDFVLREIARLSWESSNHQKAADQPTSGGMEGFEKWLSQPCVAREWEGTNAEHLRRVWVAATLFEREACAVTAWNAGMDEYYKARGGCCDARRVGSVAAQHIRERV